MRIFLSHASESKPVVQALATLLPGHVDSWLDQSEMAAGERFGRRIEDAIAETCDYLVAFIDAPALAREWVPREIAWGLRRESSLARPFVVPVLLEDLRHRLAEVPGLDERLYVMALDHSGPGLQRAATDLAAQLFALSSRLIETLRGTGRRQLLDAFSIGLTAYKQAAFQWRASLGNSLRVLTTNAEAFAYVRASVGLYNANADPFIGALGLHRDRITAAWSRHRGLCEDMRALTDRVERIYRGEMFALNGIHEMVHALMATDPPTLPDAAQDVMRTALLDRAGVALDELSQRATLVVAALEREIE